MEIKWKYRNSWREKTRSAFYFWQKDKEDEGGGDGIQEIICSSTFGFINTNPPLPLRTSVLF
jgi:hypothetical protein